MSIQVCCDRCGQLTTYHADEHFYDDVICGACREAEREPQGEPLRLFAPVPAQIPGQLIL
jgi:hypothetical protein